MRNFNSSRLLVSTTPAEEEGAYPNLHNEYKSSGDSSETSLRSKIFISFSSVLKATKALLQKLCVVFNYMRPRKTADPLLPIQDPPSTAVVEPLLASDDSTSQHSILQIPYGSLTDSMGIKPREEEREGEVKRSSVAVVKTIKHYSRRQKILLVGEGDFSFSASLAMAFGSAPNITATSLDSEEFVKKHYANAMSNIWELRRRGSKVFHEIDATKIAKHVLLQQRKFDRIIFNFPYAGLVHKLPNQSQLRRHRKLVSRFLMNAKKMIRQNGEIHITHKTNGFHAEFMVESIASSHGLWLIEAVDFDRSDFPGYNTKSGFGGDSNFDCNPSQTYKFALKTA